MRIDHWTRPLIVTALKNNGFNITRTAGQYNYDVATFRRRLASFEIDVDMLIIDELKKNKMDILQTAASLDIPTTSFRETIKRRGPTFNTLIDDVLQRHISSQNTTAGISLKLEELFELRGIGVRTP